MLQRARRSRVIFLQQLIARRAQRRRKAALLRLFTAFALQERRLRRVLTRLQNWFENLLNSNALNMWSKENFRVTRETFHFICTTVALVIQRQDTILRAAKWSVYWLQMIYTYTFDVNHAIFFFRHSQTRTRTTKVLYFDLFQVKRDAIKSNLSSARLPMSIYWLTTLGFQFTPSNHVG